MEYHLTSYSGTNDTGPNSRLVCYSQPDYMVNLDGEILLVHCTLMIIFTGFFRSIEHLITICLLEDISAFDSTHTLYFISNVPLKY